MQRRGVGGCLERAALFPRGNDPVEESGSPVDCVSSLMISCCLFFLFLFLFFFFFLLTRSAYFKVGRSTCFCCSTWPGRGRVDSAWSPARVKGRGTARRRHVRVPVLCCPTLPKGREGAVSRPSLGFAVNKKSERLSM